MADKAGGAMSSHKSTKKASAKVAFNDSESLLRFAETLKPRASKKYGRCTKKQSCRGQWFALI
jgi:hypothetical protein